MKLPKEILDESIRRTSAQHTVNRLLILWPSTRQVLLRFAGLVGPDIEQDGQSLVAMALTDLKRTEREVDQGSVLDIPKGIRDGLVSVVNNRLPYLLQVEARSESGEVWNPVKELWVRWAARQGSIEIEYADMPLWAPEAQELALDAMRQTVIGSELGDDGQ